MEPESLGGAGGGRVKRFGNRQGNQSNWTEREPKVTEVTGNEIQVLLHQEGGEREKHLFSIEDNLAVASSYWRQRQQTPDSGHL